MSNWQHGFSRTGSRLHDDPHVPANVTPKRLATRVEAWRDRLAHLGMSHFRITSVHVQDETPGGPRAEASVRPSGAYDSVEFWFKWDFIQTCTNYELDETIIHEWLHVAMRDLDEAIDSVESWMTKQAYEDFVDRVDHEREGVIDRLARQITSAYYNPLR
jgi:hypothetical protein